MKTILHFQKLREDQSLQEYFKRKIINKKIKKKLKKKKKKKIKKKKK